ncbi:peptidoglycan DD-metalloendopeptidase family protein [Algoriphagus sp.]|uniref:peptidoglycan DD-metalloendopeptidase family protein n=1 Tax=Algoriphagus sp. TaxID=1872435 RepID=UPI003918D7B9
MNKSIKSIFLILFITLAMASCKRQTLGIFSPKTEKERYMQQLKASRIDNSIMGRRWFAAGAEALENPPQLEIPAAVRGTFKSKSVEANAWQLNLQKGATLQVALNWESQDSSRVFIDIIEAQSMKEEVAITSFDRAIKFEAEQTGIYFIRIQPELMAEGHFNLIIENRTTYGVFPVQGKTSAAIQSFWGAGRDGGARKHEGIDIFASRGTPVIAPVSGVVGSVKETGLGGKQVWLRDTKRGWNLYFAHLDSQTVNTLQRVNPGDTLGFVGNTGNAITTAPHLHFGIYSRGAFDPYPVVKDNYTQAVTGNLSLEHKVMLVNSTTANLRLGPSTAFASLEKLSISTPLTIESAVGTWYQVRSPSGIKGFLSASLLQVPKETAISDSAAYGFRDPFTAPSDSIYVALENFVKIGSYLDFDLIRDGDENLYFISSKRGK